MYKRYWHHDSCETTEESVSPLVIQSLEHLCSKQWESSPRQIPCFQPRRMNQVPNTLGHKKIKTYSQGFAQLKQMMRMAHNWEDQKKEKNNDVNQKHVEWVEKSDSYQSAR